ncbi:MAG TPA: hypothetical protein VNP04_31970 [Alphaproteobacteria bacterium]|nr:hypothetical protein [Alphaproteobacteria bacterium]
MMLRQIHLAVHDRQLGRYEDLWAQRSTVDGIVVMDRMLEPVTFGGLVNLPADFKEVPDQRPRHRSGGYSASLLPWTREACGIVGPIAVQVGD